MSENKKPKMMYNYQLLENVCKENNVILERDYSNKKVNRETRILGKCINSGCNNSFDRVFRKMILYNIFTCSECTNILKKDKMKDTCLKKYGYETPLQNLKCREKSKITCLEKYGVEFVAQSKFIRDKSKATCIEKYGVEFATQSKFIKDKTKSTCIERYGCDNSGKNENVKEKKRKTFLEKYGFENPYINPMYKECVEEKRKLTCLKKYGEETSSLSNEVKSKFKDTCLKKYGVENPFQNEKLKEKIKFTCLKRYNVEHYSKSTDYKEKYNKTCLEKYGTETFVKSKNFKEKFKTTCLEKYNCEHPMQNQDVAENMTKNKFKSKDYVMPSGKIIKVQGYERFAIDELLQNENIAEDDIVTGCRNVPTIWYIDDSSKKHRHYVDIFIPSQNRCIEVKSTWTSKLTNGNIFLKQTAGKQLGYKYEIWIYDSKGLKVEEHE